LLGLDAKLVLIEPNEGFHNLQTISVVVLLSEAGLLVPTAQTRERIGSVTASGSVLSDGSRGSTHPSTVQDPRNTALS
jgi:hypothetical protein